MTITSVATELPRDRYGRPLVTPTAGGKPVAYTRCTTYIDCIEDKFNLQQWEKRMVALGLASRKDLLLSVSAHRDDKQALNRICGEAKEASAASAAATTGTALHALTELIDRGQKLPDGLPDEVIADLDAYAAATKALKSVMIEQFCVLDTLKIGGTPDRVVEIGGQRYIADLKTGSIDWGALKIAAQLAVYSRSYTYDHTTGERGVHEADVNRGIVIHLPAGQATCELHWIDLKAGWEAVKVATQVRDQRKVKFADVCWPFDAERPAKPGDTPAPESPREARHAQTAASVAAGEVDLAGLIDLCANADDVRTLWSAHAAEWDDALTARAKAHIASLASAS